MGKFTKIAWCDHTWNPWIGCTAVSAACDHCYAEELTKRYGGDFSIRRRTSAANWKGPIKWNREAQVAGVRKRVFCASLADVFDNKAGPEWRDDLWRLIATTPHLDWLLLTKRPQNIAKMLPSTWARGWPNVWLGTTVENQTEADRRIAHLMAVPAAIHFLSCEPLLGSIDLRDVALPGGLLGTTSTGMRFDPLHESWRPARIAWVISGGESGRGAREMLPDWDRSLQDQCKAAGIAFFRKQIGSKHPHWPSGITGKGDDPAQWPEDLRVQQWPDSTLAIVQRVEGV